MKISSNATADTKWSKATSCGMWAAGGMGVLWLSAKILRGWLTRRHGSPPRRILDTKQLPADAISVQIGTNTDAVLHGWLRRPLDASALGPPGPVALVIHGWGASADDMMPLSEPLLEAGLRVLLIDARGHGHSGDVRVASMPTFAEDLRAALRWLRFQPEIASDGIVLVGHSVGAGAALFVASDDLAIAGVVSLSSMAAPREFMAARLQTRLPSPLVRLALRYVEHIIGYRFGEFAPLHTISRCTAPILLVHGALDPTVPVRDAQRLHTQLPDRSTLLVLPEAHHADLEAIHDGKPELLRFLFEAGVIPVAPNVRKGAVPRL